MSRLRMPQMAEDASGKFGKNIVYAAWKGRPYSRLKVTPKNPKTEKQVIHRTLFKQAIREFLAMTAEQKNAWNKAGELEQLTGLNLFVREYFSAKKDGREPLHVPKAA